MSATVSERIAILRYLMIVGIVWLHTPPYVPLDAVGDAFGFIKAFVQHGLFRLTVPTLTVISGFLLFGSGLDRRVRDLVRKKGRSLLVPLVLWNLPLVLALYLAQRVGSPEHVFRVQLYPLTVPTFLDATFGLRSAPVNYPLNFLRDLLVLALLSPLFGLFLRQAPVIGLGIVAGVFLSGLDGPLLLRDTMAINFYCGGLLAGCGAQCALALDRWRLPLLVLLAGLCAGIASGVVPRGPWMSVVAPALVWPAASFLQEKRRWATWLRARSAASFPIFLAHGPILLAVWLAYQAAPVVPYPVFWVLAPLITVIAVHGALAAAQRMAPRVTGFATGGHAVGGPVPSRRPSARALAASPIKRSG